MLILGDPMGLSDKRYFLLYLPYGERGSTTGMRCKIIGKNLDDDDGRDVAVSVVVPLLNPLITSNVLLLSPFWRSGLDLCGLD